MALIQTSDSVKARKYAGLLAARSAQARQVRGGKVAAPAVTDPGYEEKVFRDAGANYLISIPAGFTDGEEIIAFREGNGCWKKITLDLTTGLVSNDNFTSLQTLTTSWKNAFVSGSKKLRTVFGVGQSNQAGRGGTRSGEADDDEATILAAEGITLPMDEAIFLHVDSPTALPDVTVDGENVGPQQRIDAYPSSWGPEVTFMKALRDHYGDGEPLLYIKCAEGGTSLAVDWNPASGTNWGYLTALWAEVDAVIGHENIEPDCLFYVQGEADAAVEAHALAFGSNWGGFLDAGVSEGMWTDDTPVMYAPLNPEWSGIRDYLDEVNAGFAAVEAARANVHSIDVSDLTEADGYIITSDLIHYHYKGSAALGNRAAAKRLSLL